MRSILISLLFAAMFMAGCSSKVINVAPNGDPKLDAELELICIDGQLYGWTHDGIVELYNPHDDEVVRVDCRKYQ